MLAIAAADRAASPPGTSTSCGPIRRRPRRSTCRWSSAIAAAITCGRLKDGEALPPERILSERLEVSRTTVRKALDELTARGLVTSRQGSGNFVAAAARAAAGRAVQLQRGHAGARPPPRLRLGRARRVRALARGGDRPGARQRRAGGAVRPGAARRRGAAGGRAGGHRGPRPAGARWRSKARSTRPCGHAGWSRSGHCSICAPPRSAPMDARASRHRRRQPGDGHGPLRLSRRRPPGRVHPLGLSRRPLRLRRRDAPRPGRRPPLDQTSAHGPHPDPGRLGRRHLALHRPDHRHRAGPGARRPVHRARASSICTCMAATAPIAWTAPTRFATWRGSTRGTARPRCWRPR